MKIKEAIQIADGLISNSYSVEDKLRWISAVDALLQRELVERYEGGQQRNVNYTVDDMETELIAHAPYDDMYVMYITVKIHFFNGETELYNNAAEEYNNILHEYRKWYCRTHRDLPTPKIGKRETAYSADFFNRAMQAANGYKGEVSDDVSAE